MAYANGGGLHVLSLLDSSTVLLGAIREGRVRSLAWSSNQRCVAYAVDVRMKSWELFFASHPPAGAPLDLGNWHESISFSPDGQFIIQANWEDAGHGVGGGVEAANLDTGKRELLYRSKQMVFRPAYSPDGLHTAFLMTEPEPGPLPSDDDLDYRGPDRSLCVLSPGAQPPFKIRDEAFDFDWSPTAKSLPSPRALRTAAIPQAPPLFSSAHSKETLNSSPPSAILPWRRNFGPTEKGFCSWTSAVPRWLGNRGAGRSKVDSPGRHEPEGKLSDRS